MTSPDTNEGQTMLSSYLSAQDADGDSLLDQDQVPAACTPFPFTSKRLKIIPPCITMPLPEMPMP